MIVARGSQGGAGLRDSSPLPFVARSVAYAPYPHRARIVLHVSIEKAAERVPPGAGTLEALDDHTCELRMGASSLDTLSVYLGLIGFDFEVREPPELVEHLRSLAERFSRATSWHGSG